MDNIISPESVLKELKKSLNKFESALNDSQKEVNKKEYDDLGKLKSNIANKIKLVKTIVKTEEQKIQLNTYEELNSQLNERYKNVIKKNKQKMEKSSFEKLFNQRNSEVKNKENIEYLDDEKESLKNAIKISAEISKSLEETNEELDDQNKKLAGDADKMSQILGKIPLVNKMLGQIKCIKIKQNLVLGCVLGGVIVLGLHLTFRKT